MSQLEVSRFPGGSRSWSDWAKGGADCEQTEQVRAGVQDSRDRLYRSSAGRTIVDVARELGIGTKTFPKWVRQDEADRGERDDRLTSKDAEELKPLRRGNAELKRTNEILCLASAFRLGGRPDPAQVVTFVENASSPLRRCAATRRDRRTGAHLLRPCRQNTVSTGGG